MDHGDRMHSIKKRPKKESSNPTLNHFTKLSSLFAHLIANRRRNIIAEIANITKAVVELAVTIFNISPIGLLNNRATEMIRTAPVNPIPKIKNTKILFIQSPPYAKAKQATIAPILAPPIAAYAPIHAAHIVAVTGVGTAQEPPHATAII